MLAAKAQAKDTAGTPAQQGDTVEQADGSRDFFTIAFAKRSQRHGAAVPEGFGTSVCARIDNDHSA